MGTRLVIDNNTVYELDEECMLELKTGHKEKGNQNYDKIKKNKLLNNLMDNEKN